MGWYLILVGIDYRGCAQRLEEKRAVIKITGHVLCIESFAWVYSTVQACSMASVPLNHHGILALVVDAFLLGKGSFEVLRHRLAARIHFPTT